ncbi:MAG: MMPL family transporter, partial [Solirubrobacterales bacterium]|nr:MMPL family transporter [Solirubrobacterales bacterium]
MSPSKPSNLAARMGRWSAQHRKKAILGWLAFVVIAVIAGMQIGMRMLSTTDSLTGESAVAQRILSDAGYGDTADETVLVESSAHTIRDPQFRDTVRATVHAVSGQHWVSDVRSPLDRGGAMLVSRDGHSALVQFNVRGDMLQTMDRVAPVLRAVAGVQTSHQGFRVEEFGTASFGKAANDSAGKDFSHAEILAIPVTVLILLLAFGAFLAAILPVVLALTAFFAATGLVFITSNLFPIDHSTFSVMLLIGLAVGVDYSLFYIRREREERAAGRSADAALQAAAATSGRSVLISGLTVIVAVAGLFFTGTGEFRGIAAGTMIVVATSVLGSVTVLPALLSKLGDRIEKGRLPLALRLRRPGRENRFWNAVLTPVLRRPAVAAIGATAVLIALAVPALQLHTVQPGTADDPKSMPILQTEARIQTAFPGGPMPAQVVVKADNIDTPAIRDALARFRTEALATGLIHDPISVHVIDRRVAIISAPLAGTGKDTRSNQALQTLRSNIIPATLAETAGVQTVAVGGETASSKDYNDTLSSHTPLVFMFVLGLAFLLLLVTFRSIVIPLKAIVLNLLSVGAAYGLLVLVFQDGHGRSLLGFHTTGAVTSWLPLFLFVVLFGLSMDYHVFILSRIREGVDRGLSTREAVRDGVRRTAGVVTGAAVVMVGVFSIFGSLRML